MEEPSWGIYRLLRWSSRVGTGSITNLIGILSKTEKPLGRLFVEVFAVKPVVNLESTSNKRFEQNGGGKARVSEELPDWCSKSVDNQALCAFNPVQA